MLLKKIDQPFEKKSQQTQDNLLVSIETSNTDITYLNKDCFFSGAYQRLTKIGWLLKIFKLSL